VQISLLESSQSLTIHLRSCRRHVAHGEWHRQSKSTKKVRCILSEVENRPSAEMSRQIQIMLDGWKLCAQARVFTLEFCRMRFLASLSVPVSLHCPHIHQNCNYGLGLINWDPSRVRHQEGSRPSAVDCSHYRHLE
jgi:hypothetical protein